MSMRAIISAILLVVLALGAWAFFRMNSRGHRINRAIVKTPPMASATLASEPSRTTEATTALTPVDRKRPVTESTARAGELLEFAADVSQLNNVANLKLQVVDQREFLGKSVWHLQAFAHTENPLRMVFELDDQFDSYSDAGTFSSMQYEMHLNERGERVDSVQRLVAGGKDSVPANITATHVLPGTRDPLGLMQYLRNVDWSKTHEVASPVYDGHKLYEVRASISGSESISVPAGNFPASKIDIHVFDNGAEVKDARFALYLANNASHTPVLLEAVLPFATARVELMKAK